VKTAGVLVWNVDPVLLHLGPLELRYYGIFFALTVIGGYMLFERRMTALGYPRDLAARFLLYAVAGLTVGARLMHCLAYRPDFYLRNPLEILKVWSGGLASHGAAVGLLLAGALFARVTRTPFVDVADCGVFAAGVGAALVRLGNFFNSEIVGRVTAAPWAVRFMRRDGLPRHPSQVYEALGAAVILGAMLALAARGRGRPRGFYFGFFMTAYFAFRFGVEFFKEYHTLRAGLTMGQYLSVPFLLVGLLALLRGRRAGCRAAAGLSGP